MLEVPRFFLTVVQTNSEPFTVKSPTIQMLAYQAPLGLSLPMVRAKTSQMKTDSSRQQIIRQ